MKKCGAILITVLSLMIFAKTSYAQIINKYLRKGNRLYEKQDFTDAEAEYKKALNKDSKSSTGLFNLGNSLYEQKRYQDAMEQYSNSAKNTTNPLHKSAADYNIGNTFMSDKKWEDAINSYKQSLLKNPTDNEARYNLAYAQEMLKKQQNGGGGKNNKQQNNQQKKQNKQQNKNQDNRQNQDQNKDQQQQQPRPEPGDINKQRANQLLSAAEQSEQKLQEQKDKKQQGQPVYGGKNW